MPPVSNPLVHHLDEDAKRFIILRLNFGNPCEPLFILREPLFILPLRILEDSCQSFHYSQQLLQPIFHTVHSLIQFHDSLLIGTPLGAR